MESSIERTRRGYAAFAAGDLDALREMFHPDITWTVPGRSTVAGTYRGADAVLGYFIEMFTRSGGTFKADLVECGEIAPGVVAAHAHCTGQMTGGVIDTRIINVLREDADGRLVEVTTYNEDQYAVDEADGQTPTGIVRRGYAAFAQGDMDTMRELFAPDILWSEPGRSSMAGEYRGIDAVIGLFGALLERSGGTFSVDLVGCAEVAPGLVTGLSRVTATLPGGSVDATNVHVFRVADGVVREVTSHPGDLYAFDAAMGAAITLPDARTAEQAQPITT